MTAFVPANANERVPATDIAGNVVAKAGKPFVAIFVVPFPIHGVVKLHPLKLDTIIV